MTSAPDALQKMGLVEPSGAGVWLVCRDFETVLKAMLRSGDREKMLASHGALLSDERLSLVVLDMRSLRRWRAECWRTAKRNWGMALAGITSCWEASREFVPPEDGWGGWPVRYQAAVKRSATETTHMEVDRHSGKDR